MASVHPWEEAGLGVAPFRCTAVEEGALGGCAYCGTAIKIHCWIKSADGRTFKVGSDCVAKVGREFDRTLAVEVRQEVAKRERELRNARLEKQHAKEKIVRDAIRARYNAAPATLFADRPHPNEYYAGQGKTLRDYVDFMMTSGGHSAVLRVGKMLDAQGVR